MKRVGSLFLIIISFLFYFAFLIPRPSLAFWVWTPQTNKWVNPKFSVKDTPGEQLQEGLAFFEQGQCPEAIREFKKLLKHYPRSRQAPEAQFYIAACQEKQGRLVQAVKSYQLVIDKYPFSERSAEVVKRQYRLGVKLMEGRPKKGWKKVFSADDYGVVDIFRQVIKNAPYGPLAAPAQYKIGLYLLEKELYQEARDAFEKVVNDYPASPWVKAARYQMAVTDAKRSTAAGYDQKITQAAVKEFHEFLASYPDAELSEKAKKEIHRLQDKEAENAFVIARFYEKQKRYDAARVYYQKVVEAYGRSSWAVKALKRIQALGEKETNE